MASHSIICYPQPSKAKSSAVLAAFAAGCGANVHLSGPNSLAPAPSAAAFYGVVGIEHLLNLARAEAREWYYGDNSYFDSGRGKYYRFTKNAFQAVKPFAEADFDRLKALGVEIKPWRTEGSHIVIVEQSAHFHDISFAEPHWASKVITELRKHTDRPLKVRYWRRDKDKASAALRNDLMGAWALVTHMSAAANEALAAGVPVFVSGQCAAAPLASGELAGIESAKTPDGRELWAARLSASQWTLEEMRNGKAWSVLNANSR